METSRKRPLLFACCGLLSLILHILLVGWPVWWPRPTPARTQTPILVEIVMEALPAPVSKPEPEPAPTPEAPPEPKPEPAAAAPALEPALPEPAPPEPAPAPPVEAQAPPEVPPETTPVPEIRVLNEPDHQAEESAYWSLVSQRIATALRTGRPSRPPLTGGRVVLELSISADGSIAGNRISGGTPSLVNRVRHALRDANPLPPPPAHLPTPLEAQLPIRFESR